MPIVMLEKFTRRATISEGAYRFSNLRDATGRAAFSTQRRQDAKAHGKLEKLSLRLRAGQGESGGKHARTPDASRSSWTPGSREAFGLRAALAPLLAEAQGKLEKLSLRLRTAPGESGGKHARTPDASRIPQTPGSRGAFGVRVASAPLLDGARNSTQRRKDAKAQGNDGREGTYPVEPERCDGVFLKLLDSRNSNAFTINPDFGCGEWPGQTHLNPE